MKSFRMACSRDESHGRAPADPPESFERDGVRYMMPVDPSSGGTWVAANEHGLALTLLNYNLRNPPTGRDRSRGDVIPALIHARSVHEVIQGMSGLEPERMMPFRLVACDGESVMLWRSTEPVEQAEVSPWDGRPVMFTSSGLGDHLVEGPRRELFDGWFGEDAESYFAQQRAFHQHRWPGREHLSINMHREDARTVSYTVVDVEPTQARMHYYPDGPAQADPPTLYTLDGKLSQR